MCVHPYSNFMMDSLHFGFVKQFSQALTIGDRSQLRGMILGLQTELVEQNHPLLPSSGTWGTLRSLESSPVLALSRGTEGAGSRLPPHSGQPWHILSHFSQHFMMDPTAFSFSIPFFPCTDKFHFPADYTSLVVGLSTFQRNGSD